MFMEVRDPTFYIAIVYTLYILDCVGCLEAAIVIVFFESLLCLFDNIETL